MWMLPTWHGGISDVRRGSRGSERYGLIDGYGFLGREMRIRVEWRWRY
jgi:hypothetical protein